MSVPSIKASRGHYILCPFCESGELGFVGSGFARCGLCGLPLLGAALETLRDVVGLPEAVGHHACECGHPEMRLLPDGVFHCPACGSEVLPIEKPWLPRPGEVDLLAHGALKQNLTRASD